MEFRKGTSYYIFSSPSITNYRLWRYQSRGITSSQHRLVDNTKLNDIRKYDKSLDRIKLKEGKSQYRLILIRKEVGMLYELRFKKVEDTWYLVYCFIDAC